ncbi:MAG: SPFH domain-containing protein [Aliidongia sp.]
MTVPTTNFVLRWVEGRSEEHGFDSNLAEIRLITRDAFEPILPLSIVLHIGYEDASWVVQQFADIKKLVEQTLDPMVSAYFKDAAQSRTLIELVNQRAEVQREAVEQMRERFQKYRLNVMEVMIGTPRGHADRQA